MAKLETLLERLHGVKQIHKGWMSLCPAHADKRPSLSISEKNGRLFLHCHTGCAPEDVLAAIGMEFRDLFPSQKKAVASRADERRIVNTYDYTDARGKLIYQNVRYTPKDFRCRRPDGRGNWVWSVPSNLRTLYNLRAVLEGSEILFAEGEKDANTGNTLGFTATTSGNAGSWKPEFSEYFFQKKVVVVADADEAGRKYALQVVASLNGKASSVKLLELPGSKDLTEWTERGGTRDTLINLIENTPDWKPETIHGSGLLTDICKFVRSFVFLSEQQAIVIALWVVHTHAFDSADATPYLSVTSAEKQCGKTRLLEVLQTLTRNPWLTGRLTAAVLVRKLDAQKPTLLLDESDAAFGGEREYAEALRGILNTGHRRGGVASLCVGKGAEIQFKDFSTFGPKCIAGIGKLPDTVLDRSVQIRLTRATAGEVVERFRLRNVTPRAESLRRKVVTWCDSIADALRNARPNLPDELSDRQQDGAEPLLAIADAAGEEWPELARSALVQLCTDRQSSDDSIGVRLLADIHQVFSDREVEKLFSASLVEGLAAIETSPWSEFRHGRPLSPSKLARMLRPFNVTPHTVRVGAETAKGYELADFVDSFRRYLRIAVHPRAPNTSHPSQPNTYASIHDFSEPSHGIDASTPEHEIVNRDGACAGVTVSPRIRGTPGPTRKRPIEELL